MALKDSKYQPQVNSQFFFHFIVFSLVSEINLKIGSCILQNHELSRIGSCIHQNHELSR